MSMWKKPVGRGQGLMESPQSPGMQLRNWMTLKPRGPEQATSPTSAGTASAGGPAMPSAEGFPEGYMRPVGMGQAAPPLDPKDVVGTGHKFGEPVSMEGIHKGIDLQAVKGTPAKSPVDGVVARIDVDPQGLGIQIVIKSLDGKEHVLAHLDGTAVYPGQQVRQGDVVGTVGSSGAGSTGPHLDYRRRTQDGAYENPEPDMGMLARMPAADEEMPMGRGQSFTPGQNPVMSFVSSTGPRPSGNTNAHGSMTPQEIDWEIRIAQIQVQIDEANRQYEIANRNADRNYQLSQDGLQLQRERAEAEDRRWRADQALQRDALSLSTFVAPWINAAFNHPWLQRLSGMGPVFGQPGGPGGPWQPSIGVSDEMRELAEKHGVELPNVRGPKGTAASVPDPDQAQVSRSALLPTGPVFKGNPGQQAKQQIKYDEMVAKGRSEKAAKKFPTTTGWVPKKQVMKGVVPWDVYSQMDPFSRSGLRTDLALNFQNFEDWANRQVEGWGKTGGPTTMPGMTQMNAANQNPRQALGTEQLVETFGQTLPEYQREQQSTWSQAAAPSVYQQV